ncbi:PREDICTED: F-box protein At4g11590-like [Camelina sativa]|uniref:F-box protein At4g11590-like n=1 Tax=Camelina sativa TaxID=90675 RepID=A0ABM0Y485_CAMSA|nr:PREDICTED: F-box protein At4g11590-like [Camelina sativa]
MITRSQTKKLKAEKDSQALATSKKGNEDVVPLDLAIEIFRRLPWKSVARFLRLSKSWEKMIRSRDFMTSYPFRSSTQPRLLVVFVDLDRKRERQDWYFFSPSSSSTSSLSRVSCPFPDPEAVEYHSHYVNGLISLGYGLEKTITNPSTGKSKTLPIVKRLKTSSMVATSFFGYDPVNDKYKVLVLCMKEKTQRPGLHDLKHSSHQHQVFTLGAKKEAWKQITYRIPHTPLSNSVCIDGVLYYIAKTGAEFQLSLMRFDLGSEQLDLFTSLSAAINPIRVDVSSTLISYEGKVALPMKFSAYNFDVWVMDQHAKEHGWLKKSFSIEPWKSLPQLDRLHIRGTTQTGEFILAPRYYSDEFNVIHYNPDTESFRSTKVEVYEDHEFKRRGTRALVFSDYVESLIGCCRRDMT